MFHLSSLFCIHPHLTNKYHGQYWTKYRLLTLSSHPISALVLWAVWPAPFLSSLIFLSAAFDQGVYCTNCFKQHAAPFNIPWIISLPLSQIQAGKTLSQANSNSKISCASLLDAIGKALAHPHSVPYNCEHLLHFLGTVLAKIVFENTGYARKQQQRFLSFVLSCFNNKRWSIVINSLWVVACIDFWAFSGVMTHCSAKTIGSIDSCQTKPISATLI